MTAPPRLPLRPAPLSARARLAAEGARMEAIRAAAAVPAACGPDIPAAPARGAFRVFTPFRMEGNARVRDGYQARGEERPRDALSAADVWDVMVAAARARHERAGGDPAGFVPPFTPGQVAVARLYRDLCERHDAGGLRCASVEARAAASGGGSGAGGWIDAVIDGSRRIEALRRRIGAGTALAVRRIRPSARGDGALPIRDRALVDAVALRGQTLSRVLAAHGWAVDGKAREALRRALSDALDRMQGYGVTPPQDVA